MRLPVLRLGLTLLQLTATSDPACCCQRETSTPASLSTNTVRIGFTSDMLDDYDDEDDE